MDPLSLAFIISAFFAGIITFLAPCTLPLVPGYLSFISGTSAADLQNPAYAKRARAKIFLNGVLYVVGFTAVFMLFGTLFGLGGSFLFQYRALMMQVGGVFVLLFGVLLIVPALAAVSGGRVNFMNKPPFSFFAAERRLRVGNKLTPGKPSSSLLFGGIFALGWSPCVGPILAVILTLAASSATVGQGALLLFIFAMGLAIPFLLTALAIGWASTHFANIASSLNWVSLVGGVFLVILGYLMFTGDFITLNSLIFRFLQSIGLGRYEELLIDLL